MSTAQELIERALDHVKLDIMRPEVRDTLRQAADRLASLSAENAALKAKLAGVDEKGLEAAHKALVPHVYLGRPDLGSRAAIAAYLAAGRDGE